MPSSKPPYPAAFRRQIIKLARSGRTPISLAREFGSTAQAVRHWVRQRDVDLGGQQLAMRCT